MPLSRRATRRLALQPTRAQARFIVDGAAMLASSDRLELHLVTSDGDQIHLLLARGVAEEIGALVACAGGSTTTTLTT